MTGAAEHGWRVWKVGPFTTYGTPKTDVSWCIRQKWTNLPDPPAINKINDLGFLSARGSRIAGPRRDAHHPMTFGWLSSSSIQKAGGMREKLTGMTIADRRLAPKR